jgi:hypothetical protein
MNKIKLKIYRTDETGYRRGVLWSGTTSLVPVVDSNVSFKGKEQWHVQSVIFEVDKNVVIIEVGNNPVVY